MLFTGSLTQWGFGRACGKTVDYFKPSLLKNKKNDLTLSLEFNFVFYIAVLPQCGLTH